MRLKNIIRMGIGVAKGRLLNKRIPLNVMLSVTNRCLSHCAYCNIPARKQSELSTRQIFDLIDELIESGTQRLGLWGGEPLIREDIGQIIDYAKSKGLFVTMDSNGYLVPERIDDLKNLDHLVLAFDGKEQDHDKNRQTGSFKKVIKAIEIATKKLPVWTITVLTKNNLNSIDFILEKAKQFGFLTTFQLIHHNDRLGRNAESLIPSQEQYKNAIKKLISEKKKGAPIASSIHYLKYILDWPDYRYPTASYKLNGLSCWAGKLYCNIDTNGSVYPCSLLVEKMKALNYLDVGFKKAFDYIEDIPCKSCIASCFTEYNYLYSLELQTIIEWIKSIKKI